VRGWAEEEDHKESDVHTERTSEVVMNVLTQLEELPGCSRMRRDPATHRVEGRTEVVRRVEEDQ
jgi:hypothetical protein